MTCPACRSGDVEVDRTNPARGYCPTCVLVFALDNPHPETVGVLDIHDRPPAADEPELEPVRPRERRDLA